MTGSRGRARPFSSSITGRRHKSMGRVSRHIGSGVGIIGAKEYIPMHETKRKKKKEKNFH